jgi:hypothetical protein
VVPNYARISLLSITKNSVTQVVELANDSVRGAIFLLMFAYLLLFGNVLARLLEFPTAFMLLQNYF